VASFFAVETENAAAENSIRSKSVESDKIWKAAGKPENGPIFAHRQKCRLQYRKQLRDRENSSLSIYANELHDNLLKKRMAQRFGNAGSQNLERKVVK